MRVAYPMEDLWTQVRYIDRSMRRARASLYPEIVRSRYSFRRVAGLSRRPITRTRLYGVFNSFALWLEPPRQTEPIFARWITAFQYFGTCHRTPTAETSRLRDRYGSQVVDHARQNGCFFEINSSPDRLDFRPIMHGPPPKPASLIAVMTDSHGMGELPQIPRRPGSGAARGLARIGRAELPAMAKASRFFRR